MIKITNVTKRYGDSVILENACFDFPEKGIVCLMGASGGGKTTLLNLLAGFDSDYTGDISIGNTSISHMDADTLCRYRKDNIGFVFQNYHLLTGYTVLENILLASELSPESLEQSTINAQSWLMRLGISEKANEKSENLSGGQKQRVAIARALINDPQIIFADEPTGALDRATSNEIMSLLKDISADRLVVLITHDPKICAYADEVVHIKDQKIIAETAINRASFSPKPLVENAPKVKNSFGRAAKNFKVHINQYIAVSIAISIGILAFLFSLSFGNVVERSVTDFKMKNTAFNNGYIKGADDGTTLAMLRSDSRITNVYKQYKLGEISVAFGGKTEIMPEKFPASKTDEGLSYGVMPRNGMNEIAITPSLAKKFTQDINTMIGQKMTVTYQGIDYKLTISGVFNAGYDDFFVSSDIEQELYKGITGQDNYSISYDVKDFGDVVAVSDMLKTEGIESKNAAEEVLALQNTFDSLSKLFLIVSVLILCIGLFICIVMLTKLQNTRYREVGLLSALGFSKSKIRSIIVSENLLLSMLATVVSLSLLILSVVVSQAIGFSLIVTGIQIILGVAATFLAVMLVSGLTSRRLIKTEPAEALRR